MYSTGCWRRIHLALQLAAGDAWITTTTTIAVRRTRGHVVVDDLLSICDDEERNKRSKDESFRVGKPHTRHVIGDRQSIDTSIRRPSSVWSVAQPSFSINAHGDETRRPNTERVDRDATPRMMFVHEDDGHHETERTWTRVSLLSNAVKHCVLQNTIE
jgi:hypothetical protein